MTGSDDVASNPIAKALSADFESMVAPSRACSALLLRVWNWLTPNGRGVLTRGMSRRLKVSETLSLGEKRFVSILQVDGEQFLVGGSQSNIILLAKLEAKAEALGVGSFASVFSCLDSGVQGIVADSKDTDKVMR